MTTYTAIAETLLTAARTSGGITLNPSTGTSPTSGYAVGYPYGGISFRDDSEVDIKWIAEVAREADENGYFVGSWYAPHGVIFIDLVEVITDRDEAIEAGLSRTELAIYDLEKGEEITLNY